MGTIKRFEEIQAWQTARELTRLVYALSNDGAFSRDFGLRDQMRRAAVSVMSNIAEGFESRTQPLFIEFLGRAKGSAGELRSQTYVALDAGYINQFQFTQLFNLCEKCSRQITLSWHILKPTLLITEFARAMGNTISTLLKAKLSNPQTSKPLNLQTFKPSNLQTFKP